MSENNELEPYRIGQILTISYEIYRKHFKLICMVAIVVLIPLFIISEMIPAFNIPEEVPLFPLSAANESALRGMYIWLFLSIVFDPLAVAAITVITLFHMTGREITKERILGASLMQWPKLAVTAIFYTLAVFLPSITLILLFLGLYLSVLFAFATNIVAVTGSWGVEALSFSRKLVHGKWFATFFKILTLNLLLIVAVFLEVFFIASISDNTMFYWVTSVLFQILISFFYVANALIFVNYFMIHQNKLARSAE